MQSFYINLITVGAIAVAMAVSAITMLLIMIGRTKCGKFIIAEMMLQMIEAMLIGMYLVPILRPTAMVSESLYKFILSTCPAGAQIMIGIICVAVWWQIEDRKEWKKEQEDQVNKPDNEKEDQAEQDSKSDNKE